MSGGGSILLTGQGKRSCQGGFHGGLESLAGGQEKPKLLCVSAVFILKSVQGRTKPLEFWAMIGRDMSEGNNRFHVVGEGGGEAQRALACGTEVLVGQDGMDFARVGEERVELEFASEGVVRLNWKWESWFRQGEKKTGRKRKKKG